MVAKNMPPLPFANYWTPGECYPLYTADQMHAYARAYAAERTRPLVEALTLIAGTDPVDAALDPQRALRVALAALAAEQEHAK